MSFYDGPIDPRDRYKSILMRNALPRSWRRDRASQVALLLAIPGEIDNFIGGLFGARNFLAGGADTEDGTVSEIEAAKNMMLVDTALSKYLTALGNNYGVPRSSFDPNNDTMYRKVIQVMGLPKTIMLTSYRLAEAIFGTQTEIITGGGRAWQFYEVNANEIIFECPVELISGSNVNASYLHGSGGDNAVATGPTNTFTVKGQDLTKIASTLSGRTVYIEHTGAWNTYTTSSITYNSGTDTSTVVLTVATLPTLTGARFYFDVPGDGVVSHRGDFMAADATEAAGGLNPPVDDRVYLFGQGSLDTFIFYMDFLVRAAGIVLRVEQI